jgi:arylsulfatase A-like enzyme
MDMNQKLLLSSVLLLSGMPALKAQKAKTQSPKRPNVVFILADDLGYGDLSCFGQEKFDTPHIDEIAQHGMRFTQCYSGTTVSAPSRCCLLTGVHSGHAAIRGNIEKQPEGQFPLPDGAQTIFHDFQKAGYRTAAFGKWGLGYIGTSGDPQKQGVDEFFGYNCQLLAHSYYPSHLWENNKEISLPKNCDRNVKYGAGEYAPDIIHAKALAFLDEMAKRKDQPFFLWYPTTIPHAELIVPEDSFIQKFRNVYPEKAFKGTELGDRSFQKGGYCTQLYPRATFAAMIYRLDVYVGQIIEKLKELGMYDNTIIIFSSDNGPHREGGADPDFFNSNGMWRGYKRDLYEGGIRIPMIVSWKGHIEEGSETNLMCSFWDMMPTFRQLMNAKTDVSKMDGISLLPTLEGKKGQKQHDYLYFEFQEMNGRQAVRQGAWKLIHMDIHGNNPHYELYNINADPQEKHDILTQYPERVKEMKAIMQQAHTDDPNWPL